MEHSMHLAASHFITPTSSCRLAKKNQAQLECHIELDGLDDEGNGDDGDDGDDDRDVGINLSDMIGKALALVKQVICFQCCL
jgi:hypothetical protein